MRKKWIAIAAASIGVAALFALGYLWREYNNDYLFEDEDWSDDGLFEEDDEAEGETEDDD